MTSTLYSLPLAEFVSRTASPAPTPGGGSVAAVSAALGMALVVMAVEVTGLAEEAVAGRALLTRLEACADADVEQFEALMAAYRLPRTDPDRGDLIVERTISATKGPVELAELAITGAQFGDEVLNRVKSGIRSDVLAGQDLLRGAARAACRTADVNLSGLDMQVAAEWQLRRDAVWTAAGEL